MNHRVHVVESNNKIRARFNLDPDILVELVWLDLNGRIPRSAIKPIVSQLMTIYKDAKLNTILPIIVQRVTNRFLRNKPGMN
jgi:hypothetical protein